MLSRTTANYWQLATTSTTRPHRARAVLLSNDPSSTCGRRTVATALGASRPIVSSRRAGLADPIARVAAIATVQ
jgi:hypothetical protein